MAEEDDRSGAQSRVASATSSRGHPEENAETASKSSALVGVLSNLHQ